MLRESTTTPNGARLTFYPDKPESPLEIIYRWGITLSSNDNTSDNQMDAFRYEITVGWDEEAYQKLKDKFGWQEQDVAAMKRLREVFILEQNRTWR